MQDGPVELLPFLFLGSAIHSSRRETLAAAGITAVLNVSSTCPNFYEGEFQYLRLTVEDNLAADIRACFSTAIAFIGEFLFEASTAPSLCTVEAQWISVDETYSWPKNSL